MAKLSEILEIERARQQPAEWAKIHLFKEGGFYRAYEWSAWLISVMTYNDQVRMATRDRRPLAITHKRIKDSDQTYTFVGFPLQSHEKFIPQRTAFTPVSDSQIDITIALPQPADGTPLDYDRLEQAFGQWKQQQPVQEAKPKDEAKVGDGIRHPRPSTLCGIMAQILAYPAEQHTLIENTQFISDIKQQLAALL